MDKTPALDGPRLPPAAGGAPRQLVILVHGYGADGDDLIGLGSHWAAGLPEAGFVAPHAPEACARSPMGRQWFDLGDYDPERMRGDEAFTAAKFALMLEGAQAVAPALDAFIDAELARAGLDDRHLALVGFSQGTMLALHVGLRRPRALAGIVGFSGSLVGPERLAGEIRARPPILLVHGDADEVVPVQALPAAVAGLGAVELLVEWHVSPGTGHGIAPDGLELGGRFLARNLAAG